MKDFILNNFFYGLVFRMLLVIFKGRRLEDYFLRKVIS